MIFKNLLTIFLAISCFLTGTYGAEEQIDTQVIPIGNLTIQNTQLPSVLDIKDFESVKKLYNSRSPMERKIGKLLMKNIAQDKDCDNRFESLRILLKSNLSKDSFFSEGHLFKIILCPDIYTEKEIIESSRILMETYTSTVYPYFGSSFSSSRQLVGARQLIKYPEYRYESAIILHNSNSHIDKENSLSVFRLICQDQEEDVSKRFDSANILCPINNYLRQGGGHILDSDREIALNVYRYIANQQTINEQITEKKEKYSLSDITNFKYSSQNSSLKRLYDVAEFLLNESVIEEDVQSSLNAFRKIASVYQSYPSAAYEASQKLEQKSFDRDKQLVLMIYNHIIGNLDANQFGGLSEREMKSIDVLLNVGDLVHKKTALISYWNRLICIENSQCRHGSKIYPGGVCEIQKTLVNQGSVAFIVDGGEQKRLDVAALDNIHWLIGYINHERTPSGRLKFSPDERYSFEREYKTLFNVPASQRPYDREFISSYQKVYNRLFGVEQPHGSIPMYINGSVQYLMKK